MIDFRITDDVDVIKKNLIQSKVWRLSSDDSLSHIKPGLFFLPPSKNIYILAGEYGLLVCEPRNGCMYEVHVALNDDAIGKAKDICVEAIHWFFSNSNALRLFASIPEYNQLALKLARDVGMEYIGLNKGSFMKYGKLYDQYLFGISKEEVCHH